MTAAQKALLILCALCGSVVAFMFNFLILYKIFIPDPCYYHLHEPGLLFNIFYTLPSWEGYHPFPSLFNFILTLTLGAGFGVAFSKVICKRVEKSTL